MADYKIQLKDADGNKQYPVTATTLVVDAEGNTAEQRLAEIELKLTEIEDAAILPLYEK